jgi:glyoxylase-like metal-dependent hydrolase (beta-lactamase superfamily II)
LKLGDFSLRAIETGRFRLDGGAMFGVVPKVLWSRTDPADELNRISMAMRSLYIEGGGRRMVVDGGSGTKLNEKMVNIYEIDTGGLRGALKGRGIEPASITDAIVTHLHFDHAGGFTYRSDDGGVALALPEATHYIQRRQWEAALSPNAKDRASFFPENFLPLEEAGRLRLLDGEEQVVPGITVLPVEGHTPGQQLVLLETRDGNLLYCGDLIPLASHINLPYIMAYDHQPLVTLKEKIEILGRAADEGWILFFEHDPRIPACRVRRKDAERFEMSETVEVG